MRILRFLLLALLAIVAAFGLSWLIFMPDGNQRGTWRLSTGGSILQLTPFTARLYTESRHSCYQELIFPAHMKLVEMLEGARVDIENDQLLLSLDGSLDRRSFDKIEGLPEACTTVDPAGATPKDVVDAVWIAMKDHYAFFDLYGVDWDDRRALTPTADATLSDDEIETLLLEMMAGLDDGHVHFGSPARGYESPSERPDWMPTEDSFTRDGLRQMAETNAEATLTRSDASPFVYGLRDDGIGYIAINEMDVPVPFGGKSIPSAADAFADVLADLADAKALVIDIRYNPGGSDTISFGIAGHFVDADTPVFTKTTKDGDGATDPFTAILSPAAATAVSRPTIVVTSRLTGSAAEIFTLAMRTLPQVTTIGEPTGGGLSDVMGFVLPNGWGLGLSNQTYLTMDGALFEGIGIPPDVGITYQTDLLLQGDDHVLKAAFEQAKMQIE